ncbi:Zn-ribbon domain-containing OB-fold protein [Gordonia terrae]|uniref:Zn-ribbon domain-containing OB-fold protein n=1 Tax=Gordonia terrae TaxID=2055 RepID=UPI003F6B4953
MTSTVVDDTLFAQLDPPVLAGSDCASCAVVAFPAVSRCPGCAGTAVSRVSLPRRGTVWTWTEQSFAPKPPFRVPDSGFEPFVVAYVDLGPVVVEARVTSPVQIGDEVGLRLLDLGDCTTFAFEKVAA